MPTFGVKVGFHTGTLSFQHTDISLPGNSRLPVALGRSLTSGSVKGRTRLYLRELSIDDTLGLIE